MGLFCATLSLKKCMKLNWNFQRDGGLLKNSSIREYFLELHIPSFDLTAIMDAKVCALFFLILLHKKKLCSCGNQRNC